MSLTIEAIYEDGVLKPIQPIALPEGAHVSLVIETDSELQVEESPSAILAAISSPALQSSDNSTFSNRDHDQEIYRIGEGP
ncbi:MAG: antitoxin family protein [Leptolyngbyaceae cyanobacterium SM2_5_2]|nr:antitoxin family protein [Leptolyngbyaceae cyanobacterium SM2_5_2]